MNFTFTPTQAKHAQELAMQLYRRRFFLPKGTTLEEPLPYLSPDVFQTPYMLEEVFEVKYRSARQKTEAELLKHELGYGLEAPKLSDSKQIVTCSVTLADWI